MAHTVNIYAQDNSGKVVGTTSVDDPNVTALQQGGGWADASGQWQSGDPGSAGGGDSGGGGGGDLSFSPTNFGPVPIGGQEQSALDQIQGLSQDQIALWKEVMANLGSRFGQPVADQFGQEVHDYVQTLGSLQKEQAGTIQNAADLRNLFGQRGQHAIGAGGSPAQEFLAEESGQEGAIRALQGRLQAALSGNAPVDPGLERALATEQQTLNQGLQNQLGPGYALSSPATQRLNDFALGRAGLRYQVGQQEINRDLPTLLNWQNPRLQQILFQGSGLQPSQISTGGPALNSILQQSTALPPGLPFNASLLNQNALAQFNANAQSSLLAQQGGIQSGLLGQQGDIQSNLLNQQFGNLGALQAGQNQSALLGAGIGAGGQILGAATPSLLKWGFSNIPVGSSFQGAFGAGGGVPTATDAAGNASNLIENF